MLFAKVKDLPEKLPLSLASGGMSKLAAILLSMSYYSGGVILIDEIENGLYHKTLPSVWDAILKFARQYDCQVFASTHSDECLRALADYAQQSPEEVGVIRTHMKDGASSVLCFGGDKFTDARAENIEIR